MNSTRPRSSSHNLSSGVRASMGESRAESVRGQRLQEARLAHALREVPRGLFFTHEGPLSDDQPAPLGNGRTIPPVDVVAMMIRALELTGSERVLDVGGGSGYQAALLGQLALEVYSVEADEELTQRASHMLAKLGHHNVHMIHADGSGGWPQGAPYQAIVVGAAAQHLPGALIEQLDQGGRLVIALGDSEYQLVERMRKRIDGLDSETIGTCRLDMLTMRGPSSCFPWANASRS
ncbi:MAG: protein-L-isoaspartate O-methyltransferase family protein [Myxococcota bacterium]